MDEGQATGGRLGRRDDEEGEDDESRTRVERSSEGTSAARRQTEEQPENVVPVFEDMEEPTVEIAVWTTAREEALKKVM